MSLKKDGHKDRGLKKRIRFSFTAPEAGSVALVGDFNAWDPGNSGMIKKNGGRWEKTISLPPGAYEYKYVVDGQWRLDPANEAYCTNCFGTRNNILSVQAD